MVNDAEETMDVATSTVKIEQKGAGVLFNPSPFTCMALSRV
jgi:hypothetical protein